MQSERWRNCTDIFYAAIDRPPNERPAYLDEACAGDESIRRKVEVLLKYHERSGGFIETPAFEVAPELLVEDADDLIGQHLGHYRIEALLGVGGMGVVYLACDEKLGRKVGLKLLSPSLAADAQQLKKLEHEAQTASALNHPNIVTIHEIGEARGIHYIATEYIEGITLRERILHGPLPSGEAAEIASQIAGALNAAHSAGITHRDIKPENIMLRRDGYVKILDFGIAKSAHPTLNKSAQTRTQHLVLGTARYMSPEQVRGRAVDARSDVWSLGIVLYEMLVGQPPFTGDTNTDVIASVLRSTVPRLDQIPSHLRHVINRALAKEPKDRYENAGELRLELLRKSPQKEFPVRAEWRVAVLPLANLSGRPDEEFFTDGMTEALITDLSKIPGLKVISRGSVMGFKGTNQPISEIGRLLGVDSLLEGSVLRSDKRVRISARLVRAETEECLWAERYDRDLADVLTLQDEVARATAQAIDKTLHRRDAAAPRRIDPKVYLLDLRGRHFFHQRTEQSFREALRMFEDAVAHDPTYTPAHVGIAESLNLLGNYGFVSPREIRPQAFAAAERALELDPHSADARRLVAFVYWQFDFQWEAALAEYERALELNPNSPATTYWFGIFLAVIGFFDRSGEMLDRARELDPLSLVVPSVQGWTRIFARRFEEALPFFQEVRRIDPHFHLVLWFQGEGLVELGRYEEGIATLQQAYELGGKTSRLLGYLGNALGRAGQSAQAAECLAELEARRYRHNYVPRYFFALVLAGLGKTDDALSSLEQAFADRDSMLRDLKADPQWDPLRSHPRFEQLMRRMNFPLTAPNTRGSAR